MKFHTFTKDGDAAITEIMVDMFREAKMGDWTADGEYYTLRNKFRAYAQKHSAYPRLEGTGWTDTAVEEVIVETMRAFADGEIDKNLAKA
jgi:hypothetical protein